MQCRVLLWNSLLQRHSALSLRSALGVAGRDSLVTRGAEVGLLGAVGDAVGEGGGRGASEEEGGGGGELHGGRDGWGRGSGKPCLKL